MCYLHDNQTNIVHGDLKSPNILIDKDGHAKITDFGLSCLIRREGNRELAVNKHCDLHNPLWSAPETLSDDILTKKSDIYSFGIILWELLTFKRPYNIDSKDAAAPFRLALAIMEDDKRPEIPSDHSTFPGSWDPALESYIKLILHCWEKSPDDRPDFPFINKKLLTIKNAMFPKTCKEHVINMNTFGDVFEIIQQMKSFRSKSFVKKKENRMCPKLISYAMLVLCLVLLLTVMTTSFLFVILTSCDHYENSRRCRRKRNYKSSDEDPDDVGDIIIQHPDDFPNDDNETDVKYNETEIDLIDSIVQPELIDKDSLDFPELNFNVAESSLVGPEEFEHEIAIIEKPSDVDSDSGNLDVKIPILISLGAFFMIVLIIILLCCLVCRKKKNSK